MKEYKYHIGELSNGKFYVVRSMKCVADISENPCGKIPISQWLFYKKNGEKYYTFWYYQFLSAFSNDYISFSKETIYGTYESALKNKMLKVITLFDKKSNAENAIKSVIQYEKKEPEPELTTINITDYKD